MRCWWSAPFCAARRLSCGSLPWSVMRSSDWWRRFQGFWRRSLEHGLALARLDPPLLDLLRPVARDLVAARELAQRRNLVAAARRLDERAARMEAAGGR